MEEAEEKKDKKRKYALSSKKRLHLEDLGEVFFIFQLVSMDTKILFYDERWHQNAAMSISGRINTSD